MDRDERQSIAIHLTHLTADTMAYLSAEGFSISTEPGWLFFAGQQQGGPPTVRVVHQSALTGPVLRLLADEDLALVTDGQLLCFVRLTPPSSSEAEAAAGVPQDTDSSASRETSVAPSPASLVTRRQRRSRSAV